MIGHAETGTYQFRIFFLKIEPFKFEPDGSPFIPVTSKRFQLYSLYDIRSSTLIARFFWSKAYRRWVVPSHLAPRYVFSPVFVDILNWVRSLDSDSQSE